MAWPSNTYAATLAVILGLLGCGTASTPDPLPTGMPASTPTPWPSITLGPEALSGLPPVLAPIRAGPPGLVTKTPAASSGDHADAIQISISGDPRSYRFSVTIRSPVTGCNQYADWWEVVSPGGQLIYRRVLLHSHVGEQPFTRSGGPVNAQPGETVIIRGHMNGTWYGGAGLNGSVSGGFTTTELRRDFGVELDQQDPLPPGCGF